MKRSSGKAEDGKLSISIPIGLKDTLTLDPIRAATLSI